MRKLEPDETLVAFALATFQVGLFILLVVLGLHLTDSLRKFLSELSTTIGLGAFLGLWATTCFCTYKAVHEIGLHHAGVPVRQLVAAGCSWGACNGAVVLVVPLLVASPYLAVDMLLSKGIAECGRLIFALGVFGVFGGTVAAMVGICVGFVGALVSGGLWAVANTLAQAARPAVINGWAMEGVISGLERKRTGSE